MRRLLGMGFVVLVLWLPTKASAAHLFDIALLANGNIDFPRLTDSNGTAAQSTTPKFGLGIGALAMIPVFPAFEFETGILYVNHNYTSTPAISTTPTQYSFSRLMFPALLRFTGLPLFSFGGGFYAAQAIGSFNVTQNPALGTVAVPYTYAQQGLSTFDVGIMLDAEVDIPLVPGVDIVLDAAGYYGFINMDSTTTNTYEGLRMSGVLLQAGVKVGI